MSDMIVIDGSHGEGGGQILRSSLALAVVSQRPLRIERIRAKRSKPGLMKQHLTAAEAAAEVCAGDLEGAKIGSRAITLRPGKVRGGDYRFRVGTAGSATLVLQTVLPALLLADRPSTLILEGGTHNPWAPPFDFLERAYLPLVNRMGPKATATLERHGFYPAGGGKFIVHVVPVEKLEGFDLLERRETRPPSVRILTSNLPPHVPERERAAIREDTGWSDECFSTMTVPSNGPGNIVMIDVASSNVTEVFTAFGERGVKAEAVAMKATAEAREYLDAGAPVGSHLCDQLLLPLGISAWQRGGGARRRGGSFRTQPLTLHSETHIDILSEILAITIDVEPDPGGKTFVVCVGR